MFRQFRQLSQSRNENHDNSLVYSYGNCAPIRPFTKSKLSDILIYLIIGFFIISNSFLTNKKEKWTRKETLEAHTLSSRVHTPCLESIPAT